MSQQGLRQQSVRFVTGSAETYDGDWNRLFDVYAIAQGTTNERMLRWINAKLVSNYTSLPEAQQALAIANGAWNFSSMGTFDAGAPVWVPAGATYALDFANQRYWGFGIGSTLSALTTFSRAGAAYGDGTGDWVSYAADQPRIAGSWLNYEPARTNLNTRLKDVAANWATTGGTFSSYAGTQLGIFDNMGRHASAGGLANRRASPTMSLTSGVTYAVTLWYMAGTSNKAYVFGTSTNFGGYAGDADTLLTAITSGGSVSGLKIRSKGSVYEVSYLFTPNTTATHRIGLSPYSTTVGEDVIVLGGQIEQVTGTPGATSPIMTTGSTGSRAADAMTLKLPASAGTLTVEFDDGTTQQFSDVSGDYALDPLTLNQTRIVQIYFVPNDGSLILPTALTTRMNVPFRIWLAGEADDGSLLFRTDLSENSLMPFDVSAATYTYYVDPVNGNDSNAGTEAAPFKSQYKAVHNVSGNIVVYSKTGVLFDKATAFKGATVVGNVILLPWGDGDVISSMHLPGLTWTATAGRTNVYEATDDGTALQVFDASVLTADGSYSLLARQVSIANVESVAGSYYVTGGKIYVHTSDNRAPDSSIRVYADLPNLVLTTGGTSLFARDHRFEGGKTPAGSNLNSKTAKINTVYVDCEFNYSKSTTTLAGENNGLNEYAGGTTTLVRCTARTAFFDGLNYHTWSATRNPRTAIEIDCCAYDCGQQGGGGGTNNGSTMHDSGAILRLRTQVGKGVYASAQNRTIHDINSSVTVNLGIVAEDSRAANETGVGFAVGDPSDGADATVMYNYGTKSVGNLYDRETYGVSTIYSADDVTSSTDYAGASVLAWTPTFNT